MFSLIETPGSTSSVIESESTKRNIFFNGRGTPFTYYDEVKTYQFNARTTVPAQVVAEENDSLRIKDSDRDSIIDIFDNCPFVSNSKQLDTDKDNIGNACDSCPNTYDRYNYLTDISIMSNDLDGDGVPALCDPKTPESGMALLEITGTSFQNKSPILKVGDNIYRWVYDLRDSIEATGDFNGDGSMDFIIRNSTGMGFIQPKARRYLNLGTVRTGDTLGRWTFDEEDRILGTGDYNGDGKDEILIHGQNGLHIVGFVGGRIRVISSKDFFQKIGGWLLGKFDRIISVGDMTGNGSANILLKSSWGIAIIELNRANNFKLISMVKHGMAVGGWTNMKHTTFSKHSGDFNGDGKRDIIVSNSRGIGALTFDERNRFTTLFKTSYGTSIGTWKLVGPKGTSLGDRLVAVGDLNADNNDEILLQNKYKNKGLAILSLNSRKQLYLRTSLAPRQRAENWLYRSSDKILGLGNFDSDTRNEIAIRSSWGLGILKLTPNNKLKSIALQAYESWQGDWFLKKFNSVLHIGNFIDNSNSSILIRSE